MTASLKNTIKTDELALQTIPLMVKSETGRLMSFAIVEDEYDRDIFYKFFNHRTVRIFISCKSAYNHSRGNNNVKEIVQLLSEEHSNIPVLGIIDADYSRFIPTYHLPENIFRTDCRDIEMMMFQCQTVHRYLNQAISQFNHFYTRALAIARQIGYVRIANDVYQLKYSFKKNLKFSKILQSHTGELNQLAFNSFVNTFLNTADEFTADEFNQCKNRWQNNSDSEICRGHDMLTLLANFLRNKTTKREIELGLAVYYQQSTFEQTQLFTDLFQWGLTRNKQLFN
jgi:hypothetical protein